jgi:hypothetical protein
MWKCKLSEALAHLSPPAASTAKSSVAGLNLLHIADTTEDLLLAAFQLGTQKQSFEGKEKCLLCDLIASALPNIEAGLTHSFSQLDSEKLVTAQTLRSGLEFFVDTFKDCNQHTTNNQNLGDGVKALSHLEIVQELTESIELWSLPPFDPFIGDHQDHPDINSIPASHFWWHPPQTN